MQHKLLKLTLLALLTWAVVPSLNAQMAHIGDILCEGDLIVSPANYNANTHTAIGVVFYVDNTGQHGWAVALQNSGSFTWEEGVQWGADTPLPNYTNKRQAIYDLNGYENTRVVRQHSTNHPAFYAIDFENGWYVPALGQLNCLYGNLNEVNVSLGKVSGDLFEGSWDYWSSTEYSQPGAWYLESSGELNNYGYYYWRPYTYSDHSKKYGHGVRGVRNF